MTTNPRTYLPAQLGLDQTAQYIRTLMPNTGRVIVTVLGNASRDGFLTPNYVSTNLVDPTPEIISDTDQ